MRTTRVLLLLLTFVGLIMSSGCGQSQEEALSGKYEAEAPQDGGATTVTMVLGPDHKGEWSMAHDNVIFTWEKRNQEIWLHTKTGGVIVGKISGGEIFFRLPGGSRYHFKHTGER